MKKPLKGVDFAKLRRKHPKMHLHYYDNGAWTLTSKKPPKDMDAESDAFAALVLAEGEDYNDCEGYLPDLVRDLAGALGITADSI